MKNDQGSIFYRLLRIRAFIVISLALIVMLAGGWVFIQSDYYHDVKKNLKLFGELYKYIADRYVEEVHPHELMRAGIDGMLERLDPYTVFYEGEESGDLDVLMTGQYGGIGISIGMKKSNITVISTMDGSPAQRAGIRPGDRIIAVDGISAQNMRLEQLSLKVKGEPGTELILTIQRDITPEPVDFRLKREIILVDNISYSGYVAPGIGYVRLSRFSKTATTDLMKSLQEMKRDSLRGIILDLRGNSGGMLDAAVDIANFFIRKGERITYTKGKTLESARYYDAVYEPVLEKILLAVLVDGGSASASEIVAGAVQDLDRGVIIGVQTFGKGLVQTVYPIHDKSMLKITTAKYYTPSGRCIQKEQYPFKRVQRKSAADRDDEGKDDLDADNVTKEDTLLRLERQMFFTKNRRPVYASGGVTPDIEIRPDTLTAYHADILKQGFLFDFATHFVSRHPVMDSGFVFHDSVMAQFDAYVASRKYLYRSSAEKELVQFRRIFEQEGAVKLVSKEFQSLETVILAMKEKQLAQKKTAIAQAIELELAGRYFGNKNRIRRSFAYDRVLREAVSVLNDSARYGRLLGRK